MTTESEAMTLNKLRDSMAFALYALDTQGDARKPELIGQRVALLPVGGDRER